MLSILYYIKLIKKQDGIFLLIGVNLVNLQNMVKDNFIVIFRVYNFAAVR